MNRSTRYTLVFLLAIAAVFTPASCLAQSYTITTAAGGADPHFLAGTGDGGAATGAGLGNPTNDVAIDTAGNLYIATGRLVRKVSPSGIISTVAGGGSNIGDGGLAAQAELLPTALAVDAAGNLFIADSTFGVSRVRKVDTKGIITTVAGGAGCCALGDGGTATRAYLAIPYGLAVDTAGNLYIAQAFEGNNLIRKVSNGIISTVAGGGTASGEGGPATGASLARPTGVAVDSAGNLYIAESYGNRVRKVSKTGTITTAAGIESPWHVTVDAAGNLYVTPLYDATVRLVTPAGAISTIAGDGTHGFSGDGGPATLAALDRPAGIALGSKGLVYVADATSGIGRVRLLTPAAPPTGGKPSITSGGIVSASAFGQFTSIAPGTWIEIYGSNLAADTRSWGGGDFNGVNAPTSLDGTTVTIGGQPAFLDYISPGQVVAQVPSGVPTGQQAVIATTPAGASAPYTIAVNATQAGLLAPSSFSVGGQQYVVALFSDGATYVLPPGAIAGVPSRRARAGDTITLYGIGFGPVTPNIPAGQVVQRSNGLSLPFNLSFGQTQALVTYAGLAPNAVGLYQFNVVVPSVSASDAVPLTFTLGGVSGTQTLYIAVQ